MKLTRKIVAVVAVVAVSVCIAGCYSVKHGQKIEQRDISKIQKGVTTRAEIESIFGQPQSVAMRGNGERMMLYNHVESSGNFAPFVGAVNQHAATQMLQIMIDTNNVVQDYEFTTNSSALK